MLEAKNEKTISGMGISTKELTLWIKKCAAGLELEERR